MDSTDSPLFPPDQSTATTQPRATNAGTHARPLLRSRLRLGVRVAAVLMTLAITTWVFLRLNRRFFYNDMAYDEQFFVWCGWCITKGLAPYRDFLEFKPPIAFMTHALAITLFGFKDQGYRIFFAIYPLASLLFLQTALISRGIGRLLAMSLVVGITALFVNPSFHDTALTDCESVGLTNFIFGLAFFLWEKKYVKVTTVLGGVFMTASVLSKEPFGPAVVCTWLGMFWMRSATGGESPQRVRPSRESVLFFAKYSLLGVGLAFLALSLYMVPTGAMKAYFALVKDYARIYGDPKISYCVVLGVAHPAATFLGNVEISWEKLRATFFNENVLGYLAPLAIPGAIFAYRRSVGLFVVMAMATVAGLWAGAATNCMWMHYLTMSMAGVVFVMVAGVDSMTPALRSAAPSIRIGTGVAAVVMMWFYLQPMFEVQKGPFHRQPWHEPMPGLLAFIEEHTAPSDRIFTSGPPILYAFANRVSAVRESTILDEILPSYAGSTDKERLRPLYEELVKNKPKVVFLDPEHGHRKGRHNSVLLLPYLEEFKYKKINDYLYLRP